MDSFINVLIDSPTLLISIIVFFLCVLIGFFGDRYLKRNDTKALVENDNSNVLKKGDYKDTTDEVKKQENNSIQQESNDIPVYNDTITPNDNDSLIDKVNEDTFPSENVPEDITLNQNTTSSYINNDDIFNNMF